MTLGSTSGISCEEIGDHTSRYLDEGEGRTRLEQCVQTLIRPPLVECK